MTHPPVAMEGEEVVAGVQPPSKQRRIRKGEVGGEVGMEAFCQGGGEGVWICQLVFFLCTYPNKAIMQQDMIYF